MEDRDLDFLDHLSTLDRQIQEQPRHPLLPGLRIAIELPEYQGLTPTIPVINFDNDDYRIWVEYSTSNFGGFYEQIGGRKLKPFLKEGQVQTFAVAGMRSESINGDLCAAIVIENGKWRRIEKGQQIPRGPAPFAKEPERPGPSLPHYDDYSNCLHGPKMSLLLSEPFTPSAEEWKTLCETAMNCTDSSQLGPLLDAFIKKIPHTEVIRIFTFALRESPQRHESWRGRPVIDFALVNPNPSAVMTIMYKAHHVTTALRSLKTKPELFKEAKRILDRLTYRVYQIWGKFRCDVLYGFSKLKFFDSMDAYAGWKNSVSETGALWDLQREIEDKGRAFANRTNSTWDERAALLQLPAVGQWAAAHLANGNVVFSGHDMDTILNSAWTVSSIDMVGLLVAAINSRNDNVVEAIWNCFYWKDFKPASDVEYEPIRQALKNVSTEIDAYRILKHFRSMPGFCKAMWEATKRSTTELTPRHRPTVRDGPNGMPTAADLEKLRSSPNTKMTPEIEKLNEWHNLVFIEGAVLATRFEEVNLAEGQLWNENKPDEMVRALVGLVGGVEDSDEYKKTYLNVFHFAGKKRCKDPELQPESENATSCTGLAAPGEFKAQYWYNCLTCSLDFGLGCCEPCLFKCHAGHIVRPRFSSFMCDCQDEGTSWVCKFHDKPGAIPIVRKERANPFKIRLPQKKPAAITPAAPAKVEEAPVEPKDKPRQSTILSRVGWILKNASEIPGPTTQIGAEKWTQLVAAAWTNDSKAVKSIISYYFASLPNEDITRWRMLATPLDKCTNPPQLVSVAAASPKGVGACISIIKTLGLEYERLKAMVAAATTASASTEHLKILQQEAELCAVYWSDLAYHALNIIGTQPAKIYGLDQHMAFSIVYQDKAAMEKTVPAWDDFHSLWPKGALHGILKLFETGSHGWSDSISSLLQIPAFAELIVYRCILAYSSSVQDIFQQVLSNPTLTKLIDWKHVLRVVCSLSPESSHIEKLCNAIAIEAGMAARGARNLAEAFTKLFPDIPLTYLVECVEQCPNQLVFQQITKTLAENKLITLDQLDTTKQRSTQVMNTLQFADSMLGFPSATAREEWIKSTTVASPHQFKASIDAENAEWSQIVEGFTQQSADLVKAFGSSKPIHKVLPAKISASPLSAASCSAIFPASKPTHLVLKEATTAPAASAAPAQITSKPPQPKEKQNEKAAPPATQVQPVAAAAEPDEKDKKKKKGLFSKLKSAFK